MKIVADKLAEWAVSEMKWGSRVLIGLKAKKTKANA